MATIIVSVTSDDNKNNNQKRNIVYPAAPMLYLSLILIFMDVKKNAFYEYNTLAGYTSGDASFFKPAHIF